MNFFKQTFVIILLVLISGCNSKSKNHEEKPKPDQQLKLSVKKEIDQFDEKENDKFLLTDNNVIIFYLIMKKIIRKTSLESSHNLAILTFSYLIILHIIDLILFT